MNKIFRLIIILQFFILGCTSNNVFEENKVTKKINSLDLNIFSKSGDKKYSISSPYSIYDNITDKFQFKKTTINIFSDGKTKYIINSDESALSDNNKLLELKGNVKLKTISQDEDHIYSDNFIWNIDDTHYLLTGNVRFENKNVILISSKAKLGPDNIIEFFNPVRHIIKDDKNYNIYETTSENAYYDINKETLSFNSKDKRVRSKIYF